MALFQRLIICGLVVWGGASILSAAEKEEQGRLTAVWVDGRRAAGELYVADSKGTPQKLTVGVSSRGSAVELPVSGGQVVLLRKVAPLPVPAGSSAISAAPTYESAGEVALPTGNPRKVVLLLASTGQASGPVAVKGVALADDLATFPVHSVRFANFLGGEFAAKIGDSVKSISTGVSASFPYPIQIKTESKEIPVFSLALARTSKGGTAEVLFNGRIEAWAHSRALVVIVPGPTTDADPVVRTILEVVPPPPPPPAKPKAG